MIEQLPDSDGRIREDLAPALEVIEVTKRYPRRSQDVCALAGVSLELWPGELVMLVGASGSGKTTLLSIAAGLDTPTTGEVRLGGRSIHDRSSRERRRYRRRGLGLVFQEASLIATLTAVENVSLPLELLGMPEAQALDAAASRLGSLGLAAHLDRFPDELSGGEAQRVAVARAVMGDRKVLLGDEPTASLDRRNGIEVINAIATMCAAGSAAIVATHDQDMARVAHRVVRIRDGKLCGDAG